MNDSSVPPHLLKLARDAAAPPSLTPAGRRERFGDCRDRAVERGQIWRATWSAVRLLILITGVAGTEVDAVPVTVDPECEDAEAVVLEPALTAFGVDVTVWRGLRTSLPFRVLDEIVDEVPHEVTDWVSAPIGDSSVDQPAGVRPSNAPARPFDSSAAMRALIEDELDVLRSAPGLPVAVARNQPVRTLASILGKGVDLNSLVDALAPFGFNQSDVMGVLRGKKPLSPAAVGVVARVTGVEPGLIAEAIEPLPAAFVEEVDHPRWRPLWRERAHDEGLDEAAARLHVSYEIFALAARQTGHSAPDWPARLAQFRRSRSKPETT